MNLNLGEAVRNISLVFEKNALLREQNAILSCALAVMTAAWLWEKYKRLHGEKNKKGE